MNLLKSSSVDCYRRDRGTSENLIRRYKSDEAASMRLAQGRVLNDALADGVVEALKVDTSVAINSSVSLHSGDVSDCLEKNGIGVGQGSEHSSRCTESQENNELGELHSK